MYKNILVPIALDSVNDGQTALAAAQALKDPDGVITLIHVIEEVQGYVAAQLPSEVPARNRAYANAGLDRVAERAGAGVRTSIVSGHSGRTILEEAEKMGADCIVLASHRPGLEDYFIGSTASRVVRHANCSVLVVR